MPRDDQPSRLFYKLCALLLGVIRTPHIAFPPADAPIQPLPTTAARSHPAARRRALPQISPAGFASLLLGASLALMLCGSVTFVIGFMLMPCVIGIVILLYFVGIVSNLSGLWRAIICPNTGTPSPKEMPEPHFLNLH